MSFEEFYDYVVSALKAKCGGKLEIKELEVIKNNGQKYHGVTLKNAEKQAMEIAPTLNVENFYEHYMEMVDVYTAEDAVGDIWNILTTAFDEVDINPSDLVSWEEAKGMLRLRLINKEMNQERLKEIPHVEFYDMCVVPYLFIRSNAEERMTAIVTRGLLENWNVDDSQVLDMALHNSMKYDNAELTDLAEVMSKIVGLPEQFIIGRDNIYVLRTGCYGAIAVYYDGLLDTIAEKLGDDIFIVPSSIHEVLVLRKNSCKDVSSLRTMISETNAAFVKPEEVLSNSLYVYERDKKILRIYTDDRFSS